MTLAASPFLWREARYLERVLLLALMGACALMALGSWSWRVNHDFALLSYTGYLIDRHGAVPYRDIFETSMPGTFVFHALLERLMGHSDTAFRVTNLLVLAGLNMITCRVLAPCGLRVCLWAITLFDVIYLSLGQQVALQRDYLGVIPVAAALAWLPRSASDTSRLRDVAAVGFLMGLASTFKPHLAIAWPLFLWLQVASRTRTSLWREGLSCGAMSLAMLLLPWVVALWWLWTHGALQDFGEVLFDYLPLHNAFNGEHVVMTSRERLAYLFVEGCRLGGCGATFFVGLLACAHAYQRNSTSRQLKPLVICVAGCILAYAVYPVIAGKFWAYHYLPLVYFISLGMALVFMSDTMQAHDPEGGLVLARIATVLITALAVTLQSILPASLNRAALDIQSMRQGHERHAPADGRADEIAQFLRANLRPGDTVQPLDWTGGVILGLLLAEVPLATRYMYDYHFYHHVSSAQNQKMRADFLHRLDAAKPRFVIEVPGKEKPWVSGADTSDSFEALRAWLVKDYRVRVQRHGYVIYERGV